MKIFLHEITDQEKLLHFSEQEPWVAEAALRVDERGEDKSPRKSPRAIDVKFSIRKVDNVIVIDGRIKTQIDLVCSRCASTFDHACTPRFSALFCKDPVMAGVAYLQRSEKLGADGKETTRPRAQNHGFARHAHRPDEDPNSIEGKDLDITYLSHDFIDLADVVTEQLQLQVPFQPLCKETCKGICSQCGADLNHGRCACAKLEQKRPFSVLKDFKIQ